MLTWFDSQNDVVCKVNLTLPFYQKPRLTLHFKCSATKLTLLISNLFLMYINGITLLRVKL